MRSGNPVLKESTFLDLGSGAVVSRSGEAMTLNGTVNKTGFLLLLTVLTAAFAWNQALGADGTPAPGFAVYVWGGAIGGLVLAIVTAFKKEWSPVTAPLYALVEGAKERREARASLKADALNASAAAPVDPTS